MSQLLSSSVQHDRHHLPASSPNPPQHAPPSDPHRLFRWGLNKSFKHLAQSGIPTAPNGRAYQIPEPAPKFDFPAPSSTPATHYESDDGGEAWGLPTSERNEAFEPQHRGTSTSDSWVHVRDVLNARKSTHGGNTATQTSTTSSAPSRRFRAHSKTSRRRSKGTASALSGAGETVSLSSHPDSVYTGDDPASESDDGWSPIRFKNEKRR
ncbi:hypothetical protein JCM10207_005627 [Rhodosporidiobolus poonsookiae]